jgi:hypothetical protein
MTRIAHPGVLFVAIGLLALGALGALGLRPGAGAATETVRLPFAATFDGVSNASSVWDGQLRGQPGGRVRLTLRQVESPLAAAKPVWHVQARWTLQAEPATRSFAAELEGMVDWKAGATRLGGVVTSGWMKGAWIQQIARIEDGDLVGVLEVAPTVTDRPGREVHR